MHATKGAGRPAAKEEYPDEGLHAWVILACLVLVAIICFLVLQFTIKMMSEQPATPDRPAPIAIRGRP